MTGKFHATAALISCFILSGCISSQSPMRSAESAKIPDAQLRDALLSYASNLLYDPASAQFRNIRTYRVTREDGTREVQICGEINARNRMGGYAGFQKFLIVPDGRGGYWSRGHFSCPE